MTLSTWTTRNWNRILHRRVGWKSPALLSLPRALPSILHTQASSWSSFSVIDSTLADSDVSFYPDLAMVLRCALSLYSAVLSTPFYQSYRVILMDGLPNSSQHVPLYWSLLLPPTSPSSLKSKKVMGLWNQGINWAGKCRITCPGEDLQFPWDLSVWHCWPFPDTQLPLLNSSRFLGSCSLVCCGRNNEWGKIWLYSCIIYMCPHTLIWGGDSQRASKKVPSLDFCHVTGSQGGAWLLVDCTCT